MLDFDRSGPPLFSVFGGKLTTYRRLAEDVLDRLGPALGSNARTWTATAPLPGGDMPGADFERFRMRTALRYAWLDAALLQRYSRAFGARIDRLLDGLHIHDRTWARPCCRACTCAKSST